jgi:hypothetical protein
MLNLNDIFIELSEKELCLKVNPHIAGQDTNFEELHCEILDPYGIRLLYFDYQLDHYLHGGNILPHSELNPYGWYEKISTIEDLLKHIENK